MSLVTRTDVTAVKFYKNLVLAGLGCYLNVFDRESNNLLQRIKVLEGQKIYGLVVSKCGEKILVFGGKQFSVVAGSSEAGNIFSCELKLMFCDDWLQSGVWIGENIIAFQTSHNVVQKWNTNTQEFSFYVSSNNSILYSGLLLPVKDDLIVFAGTVFSEVIIHRCGEDKALHHLKGHRGVIFSISCEPKKQIIVTTSDDRSVRIWAMENKGKQPLDTREYWDNLTIECRSEVYGHSSRVMRCLIMEDYILSAGEDSALCFWTQEGFLNKKIVAHQNAPIWAIDADRTHLVSGGGDSGINVHPITVAENGNKFTIDAQYYTKSIQFTARKNLVILNDKELVYYDLEAEFSMAHQLSPVPTFKILALSPCKQLIAVTDLYGRVNIFAENCKDTACLRSIVDTKLNCGKINSMHWAGNRHLILCNKVGVLTVLCAQAVDVGVEVLTRFELPECKEKALTAAAINATRNVLVIGDRNGNVHCYSSSKKTPLKTFKRVHGKYGPTSITIKGNQFMTTGRDGTVAYFLLDDNIELSEYSKCKELEFQWPEKFLDSDERFICGFHERKFVVYRMDTNMKVLEVPCGGGHRCWDAVRFFDKIKGKHEEVIKFVFLKNSIIYVHTFELNKIMSKPIVNGSQGKKINCLQTWASELNPSMNFIFSGGEDTTLRLSSLNSELYFEDKIVNKHLSNIRTLKVFPWGENKVLVMSGGGRAQLCITSYAFEKENGEITINSRDLGDYMVQGTDQDRKRMRTWRHAAIDFDPETRIMDLDVIRVAEHRFIIFAGCSDSFLRIFVFEHDISITRDPQFRPLCDIHHQYTCILKIAYIAFQSVNFLVTCTTTGFATLWLVEYKDAFLVEPWFDLRPSESGINALAYKVMEQELFLAFAGDDGNIVLNLMSVQISSGEYAVVVEMVKSYEVVGNHSSQITGLIVEDDWLLSTSIDQRISVFSLEVTSGDIQCVFVKQIFSDIADIQGMDIIEYNKSENYMKICVFGKGMEIFIIDLSKE